MARTLVKYVNYSDIAAVAPLGRENYYSLQQTRAFQLLPSLLTPTDFPELIAANRRQERKGEKKKKKFSPEGGSNPQPWD